jgi:hypothetical protein
VRHRPDLDEAEAEGGELTRRHAVLVEAGGEADRVREAEAEAAQFAEERPPVAAPGRAPQALRAETLRERVEGELVGRLRRKPEEQGAQDGAIEHGPGRPDRR